MNETTFKFTSEEKEQTLQILERLRTAVGDTFKPGDEQHLREDIQHAFINHYYAFDANAWHAGTAFYHDLNSGGYLAYNLFQEREKGPILNKNDMTPAMFTPQAARSAGN